jgi:DNA modification methylase
MARSPVTTSLHNPHNKSRPSAPPIGHNSAMQVEYVATASLKFDSDAAVIFSPKDNKHADRILNRFDARVPILIGADNVVAVGEMIVRAALRLGITTLPAIRVEDLSKTELQALSVAYTKLGQLGKFDSDRLGALCIKFEAEIPNFELEDIGFEIPEIDMIMDREREEEDLPPIGIPISRLDDVWLLDTHRVCCGDATRPETITALMAGAAVAAVFTDPPFGCSIDGFVAGKGRHREFVMASGEMSDHELRGFFAAFCAAMMPHLKKGAVVYIVIDWRSLHLLLDAVTPALGKLLNMAVWAKDRAGMGSFLRSQHELILIFKAGAGRYRNNVQLGRFGRDRSNVWKYPSAKTASTGSDEGNMLANHPTPKPVRMVADAILDCTKRGDIVLDCFLGSGTTLIAAEKVGRRCYALDLDPLYVDLAIRRWQAWTGQDAVHAASGRTFNDIAADVTSAAQ